MRANSPSGGAGRQVTHSLLARRMKARGTQVAITARSSVPAFQPGPKRELPAAGQPLGPPDGLIDSTFSPSRSRSPPRSADSGHLRDGIPRHHARPGQRAQPCVRGSHEVVSPSKSYRAPQGGGPLGEHIDQRIASTAPMKYVAQQSAPPCGRGTRSMLAQREFRPVFAVTLGPLSGSSSASVAFLRVCDLRGRAPARRNWLVQAVEGRGVAHVRHVVRVDAAGVTVTPVPVGRDGGLPVRHVPAAFCTAGGSGLPHTPCVHSPCYGRCLRRSGSAPRYRGSSIGNMSSVSPPPPDSNGADPTQGPRPQEAGVGRRDVGSSGPDPAPK